MSLNFFNDDLLVDKVIAFGTAKYLFNNETDKDQKMIITTVKTQVYLCNNNSNLNN